VNNSAFSIILSQSFDIFPHLTLTCEVIEFHGRFITVGASQQYFCTLAHWISIWGVAIGKDLSKTWHIPGSENAPNVVGCND
jgi:hypothetical protein